MSRITEEHIECAAYALYRFDAQRHPVKHGNDELARWQVWKRVRPTYVKRAELALQAVISRALPPTEPPRRARAGEHEALALAVDPGPDAPPLEL